MNSEYEFFSIFVFCLFCYVSVYQKKKERKKKNFCALKKTVKEWFISIRYVSETFLDVCVVKFRGMLKAVLSAKSVIFMAPRHFTPKVTQFRTDFVIVLSTDSINNCIREWTRRELMLMSSLELASSSVFFF